MTSRTGCGRDGFAAAPGTKGVLVSTTLARNRRETLWSGLLAFRSLPRRTVSTFRGMPVRWTSRSGGTGPIGVRSRSHLPNMRGRRSGGASKPWASGLRLRSRPRRLRRQGQPSRLPRRSDLAGSLLRRNDERCQRRLSPLGDPFQPVPAAMRCRRLILGRQVDRGMMTL